MTSDLLRIRLEHTEELERLARRAAQTQAALVEAIQTASRDGMSNRQIAKAAGLSHPTVAKIAAEPERYGGTAEDPVQREHRLNSEDRAAGRACGSDPPN